MLGDVLFITLWQPWYLTQSLKRERQIEAILQILAQLLVEQPLVLR